MTNIPRLINLIIGLSTSILFLSYLLTVDLQPSLYFAQAQNLTTNIAENDTKIFIPTTISKQAQEMLKNLIINISAFVTPEPDDLEGWKKFNQQINSMALFESQPIIDSYQSNVTYTKLGGVNVLDVKPQDWKDNGKILVYLHGGGYTFFSANSTLGAVTPVANITGLSNFC